MRFEPPDFRQALAMSGFIASCSSCSVSSYLEAGVDDAADLHSRSPRQRRSVRGPVWLASKDGNSNQTEPEPISQ